MTSHISTTTLSGADQSFSGTLTGASTLGNLSFTGSGTKTFANNASTSNFIVSASSTVVTPTALSISGNYHNDGTLTTTGNTTYLTGSNPQSLSGTTTFNNLYLKNNSRTGTTTFNSALTVGDTFTADGSTYIGLLSGATSTIANLTLNGSSTAPISFGSTATGTKSNLIVSGSTVVTYTRVQDSSACGSNGGDY
ncbi:MAG: hypothetical protein R3B53_01965 [Candidatus Paceibacterota bacterium]